MKSNMPAQKDFSLAPQIDIPRSSFNRTHALKTTFDASYIIPMYFDEALPGDTHQLSVSQFARLATPIVPVMDNVTLDTYFFSVPIRLLWENFEKFMGEQENPGDSIAFTLPTIDTHGDGVMSLTDYLGIPTEKANILDTVSLWHRAYNMIWNYYFRDQNLQNSVVVDIDNGPDTRTDYVLLKACKKHDYFTSCLPWPQKGDAVVLPLGTDAPITGFGKGDQTYSQINQAAYETDGSGTVTYANAALVFSAADQQHFVEEDPNNSGYPNIRADLSNATASTVNELREAYQIQRLLERDARSGTRYPEKVKAFFGVTVPDYRAQRPEFLGHGSINLIVNPVARTNDFSSTQGADLSGVGTASGDVGFTASFVEHSVVLGLMVARADLTYQQGIDRMYLRSTQYDIYNPVFAHLGEQAVQTMEIFFSDVASGTGATANTETFGYQERWAEYRYKPSKITGLFKSDATGSIDIWTLSEDFAAAPDLDDVFIQDNSPLDRVIATPTEPHFIYDSYCRLKSTRPMPVYSVPGYIDHF